MCILRDLLSFVGTKHNANSMAVLLRLHKTQVNFTAPVPSLPLQPPAQHTTRNWVHRNRKYLYLANSKLCAGREIGNIFASYQHPRRPGWLCALHPMQRFRLNASQLQYSERFSPMHPNASECIQNMTLWECNYRV